MSSQTTKPTAASARRRPPNPETFTRISERAAVAAVEAFFQAQADETAPAPPAPAPQETEPEPPDLRC